MKVLNISMNHPTISVQIEIAQACSNTYECMQETKKTANIQGNSLLKFEKVY